ncbi:unnamed protein product [Triticum turgidum subsp. durum]|uniref:CDK5RAP1-like protein n=1 Tax=Triticum turgidum subsp. durum TaxID=4567 RepID=A0A9R0VXG0_TRITD|nr:unnamed protein product [Triticum turgidum subsp. durum]
MNVSDMEIVLSIMKKEGYNDIVPDPESAEIIFINTCAIRDNAEQKVWQRLNYFWFLKRQWKANVAGGRSKSLRPPKIAVLGCMAERLKEKILDSDKMVDVVCGPDAYRDLPRLLQEVDYGQKGINTLLSLEETYADITPVRISDNSVTAFVSIMRGCNNMCSFCIVPFTRGRERSRPVSSVVREVGELWDAGVKEVMLLGQNVNSYNDTSEVEELEPGKNWQLSEGFSSRCKVKNMGLRFADLLDQLSLEYPEMRFRFTSPHPKDFPDELLYLMRDRHNICKLIHLPAQSGSTEVLERMKRGYTREAYLELVQKIRNVIPDVGLSSDFISAPTGVPIHQIKFPSLQLPLPQGVPIQQIKFPPSPSPLPAWITTRHVSAAVRLQAVARGLLARRRVREMRGLQLPLLPAALYRAKDLNLIRCVGDLGHPVFLAGSDLKICDISAWGAHPSSSFSIASPPLFSVRCRPTAVWRGEGRVSSTGAHRVAPLHSAGRHEGASAGRSCDHFQVAIHMHSFCPDGVHGIQVGFCGETEDGHADTLSLVRDVGYDMAYMFAYSMREKTHAHRNYEDDVPNDVKQRRLAELINTFRETTRKIYDSQIGTTQVVLVEGPNKRAPETELFGKTDRGHRVSFTSLPVPHTSEGDGARKPVVGDFVEVKILRSSTASLFGEPIARTSLGMYCKNHASEAHAGA